MTIIIREFNNQTIRVRESDRYVSLTDMAKASGKLFGHWKALTTTESYLDTLSSIIGIPISEENPDSVTVSSGVINTLIAITKGGIPENQGTWGHPKVALRFAQWCSDEFAVQVDCWIDELLTTGKVQLNPEDQKVLEAQRLTDTVVSSLEQIFMMSPTVYQTAKTMIAEKLNLNLGITASQNDLNASLVANRLGLAFNKHLKALDKVQDISSPDAYLNLKKSYEKLLEDYQKVLQVSAQPFLDQIKELSIKCHKLETQLSLIKSELEAVETVKDIQDILLSVGCLKPMAQLTESKQITPQ